VIPRAVNSPSQVLSFRHLISDTQPWEPPMEANNSSFPQGPRQLCSLCFPQQTQQPNSVTTVRTRPRQVRQLATEEKQGWAHWTGGQEDFWNPLPCYAAYLHRLVARKRTISSLHQPRGRMQKSPPRATRTGTTARTLNSSLCTSSYPPLLTAAVACNNTTCLFEFKE